MSNLSLTALARKYAGLSENELQNATWDEIDAIAEKRNGSKPLLCRTPGLLYAGSPYVITGRFGSLEASREQWEKLGEAE